jgi:hypothetical protein
LVWRPKWEKPPGRLTCRWEDNIKMDLRETGINGVSTGSSWLRIESGGSLL